MKKFVFLILLVLFVGGISVGTYFFGDQVASLESAFEGDDPDMPSAFQNEMTKEEFMTKREDYIARLRGVEEDKPFDPQLRVQAVRKLEKQENLVEKMPDSPEKDAVTAAWTEIGPNPIPNGQTVTGAQLPVSGRTISIAVHPTDSNIVYVGTAQGGLYRSLNGGTTWTPMLDKALSLTVGAIAIAPSQPDTVYVGTGEPNFSSDSFFGVGLYRIDNASTDNPIITGPLNKNSSGADIFSGRSIGKIIVHPTDPNTIFVGSTSGVGGIGPTTPAVLPNRGIYRSTNATSANPTFEQLPFPFTSQNYSIRDLAIDPADPNILIANIIANGGGILRSVNALAAAPTFTLVSTFTGTSTSNLTAEFAAIHPAADTNATFYAATGSTTGSTTASTYGRLLKSIDGGATFTQVNSTKFCGGQCFYDIAVAVDPTNANNVFLGGTGTSYTFGASTDGGTTFTARQSGLHTDSHVIAVAPSSPTIVYFGSDGGIYRTTDSGTNWSSLNNTTFRATQFISIAVHPTDPNFTIGGTQDNGTEYRDPSGTWTRADYGDGGYSLIDQSSTTTTLVNMYHTYYNSAGSLKGYGYVSSPTMATEGGWTFRGCNGSTGNGIPCAGAVLFYAPIEQGPGTPNTVYYGANILYRSADTGLTHTAISQDFTNPISAIGISPQDDNDRIVGINNGGIFGTINGATTLTDLDPSNMVPNNYIARAVIDPNNKSVAYVTLSAFGINNVWKSTNINEAAPTWTAAVGSGSFGLPQVPINAFLVDPLDSNRLYAGTDIGVYTSPDSGTTWLPFGTGLPRIAVFDMAITSGRLLRIATHGRGMWEIAAEAPQPFEADVQSRPNGDGYIDADDIQQIRRFATGLDTPSEGSEFQRADDSPRSSEGDGMIDADDVQQARRYSVGTDAKQMAAGPTSPTPTAAPSGLSNSDKLMTTTGKSFIRTKDGVLAAPAAFRVDNQNTSPGSTLVVPIRVDTVGNEAGYTFSIAFDSTILTNPQVAIGNGGGDVVFNTNNPGQIGFSVTSFSGGTIAEGNNIALVNVTFTVAAGAAAGTTPITFTDTPARRKASGVDPNTPITQPTYTGGTITISGATAAGATISGRILTSGGRGVAGAQVIVTDRAGAVVATGRTNGFGYYTVAEIAAGESYIVRVASKQYQFAARVITIVQDIDGIDFTAQP